MSDAESDTEPDTRVFLPFLLFILGLGSETRVYVSYISQTVKLLIP